MRWKQCRTAAVYLLCMMGGALLYHLLLENTNQQSSYSNYQRLSRDILSDMKAPVMGTNKGAIRESEDRFRVTESFHFPQPHYSRPDSVLLRSPWVRSLKGYLKTVKGNQISLVTSTEEHKDVLVNWLISAYLIARPPLDNVLVLSMGRSLHNLLESHGFSSLYVSADMVTSPRANITRVFSQVHIVRLNVVRLINHLGFDVVNYDCDAILLKNPQRLFDARKDLDLMGTFGKGPSNLYQKWGVTLNTGVMLLRANPQIEFFWEKMASLKWTTTDDQGSINRVLESLNVKWLDFKSTQNIDHRKEDIFGIVRHQSFKMFIGLLSFEKICRHTCTPERRRDYFVWHALAIKENRTVERKMSQARLGGAWFLSEQWEELSHPQPILTPIEWLKLVMDKGACSWSHDGLCE